MLTQPAPTRCCSTGIATTLPATFLRREHRTEQVLPRTNGQHGAYPKMYVPGASPSTGYFVLPSFGGVRWAPARFSIQFAQSSHQVTGYIVASDNHSSGSTGSCPMPFASYRDFGFGGLTMPAMCPELDSTKRTSPA